MLEADLWRTAVPIDLAGLITDLLAERAALDERVADLTEQQWQTPTPAAGWDVRDSVSHLLFFDAEALLALTDRSAFEAHLAELMTIEGWPNDLDVAPGRTLGGSGLLSAWRVERTSLMAAIASADPTTRVPWYGPAMSLASFTTARMMETWAHGQDVADALGLPPVVSERLKHVCHIGVGARAYAYLVHEQQDSGHPVRFELVGPAGDVWTWGPPDASDSVRGSALDFALLATQRRHLLDTSLVVVGDTATHWMSFAQAFAGGVGHGREPLA
jgi:uncharacterized protein (TIGR03084 family)